MPEFYQQFSEIEEFNSLSAEDKLQFGSIYADQVIASDERFQQDPEAGEFLRKTITDDISAELPEPEVPSMTSEQFFQDLETVLGPGVAGDVEQLAGGIGRDINTLRTIGQRSFGENLGMLGSTGADILKHTVGIPVRVLSGLAQLPHFAASAALETIGLGDSSANEWIKAQYYGLEQIKKHATVYNGLMSKFETEIVTAGGVGAVAGKVIFNLTHRTLNTAATATGTIGYSATDAAIVGGWTAVTGEAAIVIPANRVLEHYIDESGHTEETKQIMRTVSAIGMGIVSGVTIESYIARRMRDPNIVNTAVRMVKAGAAPAEVAEAIEREIVQAPSLFDDVSKATNGRVPEEIATPTYGQNLNIEGKLGPSPIVARVSDPVPVTPQKLATLAGDPAAAKTQKTVEDSVRHFVQQPMDAARGLRTKIDTLDPVKDSARINKLQAGVDKAEAKAVEAGVRLQGSGDANVVRLVDQAIIGDLPVLTREQMLVSDAVDATGVRNLAAELLAKSTDTTEEVSKANFMDNVFDEYIHGRVSLEDARRLTALSDDTSKGWLFDGSAEDITREFSKIGLTGQENSSLGKWATAHINNEQGYVDPAFMRTVALHSVPLSTGLEIVDGELTWNTNKYLKYGAFWNAAGFGGRIYRQVGVNRIARDVGSKASRKFWSMIDHPLTNPVTNAFRPGGGLDPKVQGLRKAAKNLERKIERETNEFAAALKKNFTVEEREALSDFIEKEGNNWANIPELMKAQARQIQNFLSDIRVQLVNSGVDEDVVNKLGDKWLHRVYIPQLMKRPAYKRVKQQLKNIQGHYVMRRGKNQDLLKNLEQMELGVGDFVKGDTVYSFLDNQGTKVWVHEAQTSKLAEFRGAFDGERKWEIIENKQKKLVANTDYTRVEREMMGESRDVALRLSVFFREASHDIALGNMFKGIDEDVRLTFKRAKGISTKDFTKQAQDAGFVQLPNKRTTSGMNKFGVLNGQWVNPDVARVVKGMTKQRYTSDTSDLLKFVGRKALTGWKVAKTAYNVGTHVLNIVSNFHLSFMSGHNPITIVKDGMLTHFRKDEFFRDAVDAGLIDSGVLAGDWNIKSYLRDVEGLTPDAHNVPLMAKAMVKAWGATKFVAKLPMTAYQWEDEVFKLGTFKQLRKQGMSSEDAMAEANRWFFDYSDVPPGVEFLRDTGIVPFISFTYKVIPAMIRGAIDRPERLLAMMYAYKTINDLTYENEFGAKAEAQMNIEREVRPEFQKTRMFGIGPDAQLRIPSRTDTGEARTIDVRRYIPGADLFSDFTDSFPFGTNPAASLIYTWFSGKLAFSGKELLPYPKPKNDFQEAENFDATMKFIVNTTLPNWPAIPYTYASERVGNALVATEDINENSGWLWDYAQRRGWNGKNYFGHDLDLTEELFSAAGIRTSRTDVPQATAQMVQKKTAAFSQASRELTKELRKTRTTQARREAAVEGYKQQIGTASQELHALTTLLESAQ